MIQEETKNYALITNVLKNKKIEIEKMQKEIFKICEDPLMIDEYLIDYKKRLFNLDFHKDNPYFARIKFVEKSDNTKYDVYISKLGFYKINDDISVVDWRSPVCDLYYNGAVGDTKYRVDSDEIVADLTLKRQIAFDNGNICSTYDFDDQITNDELLKPYLTKHADTRLKNIVSTIQQEQNKIIRYPFHKNLIVQGVAGSGKTTVALHRLSYLLYNYKKSYKPYQYLVLSPNKVFVDYVSSILPELDAQDVLNTSLEQLTQKLIMPELKILNKNTQKDFLTKNNISFDYLLFKSGKDFLVAVDNFVKQYEQNLFLKPILINGIVVLDTDKATQLYNQISAKNTEEKIELFSQRASMILRNNYDLRFEILNNLQKQNAITFNQKKQFNKLFENGCQKQIKKSLSRKINIFALYKEFVSNVQNFCNFEQIEILKNQTLANLNKKTLAFDDIGPILYLFSKLKSVPTDFDEIRNIFVDEAQDLSVAIFTALSKLFDKSYFSVFGDLAQGMYSYQAITDWHQLDNVFENAEFLLLDKSYRTTVEIMQNANLILEKLQMPLAQNVLRHGETVETICVDKNELVEKTIFSVKQFENCGMKTIAIIFKNDDELEYFMQNNTNDNISKIDENTDTYNQNIIALTVKTAKGLEFDGVIIFNQKSYDQNNPIDMKELFVAKTRALHKLLILTQK